MTVTCVRCETVISRYAPVGDRESGLCGVCATEIAEAAPQAGGGLYCGRAGCLLEMIPYGCLVAEARDVPIDGCPAVV